MNSQRTCAKCGAALAADAPDGLCPGCLIKLGLATQSGGASEPATAPANPPPNAPPSPPSPAELAPHFPQLEIVELLGQGGMGLVYKARQRQLDRWVALKILPQKAGHDPAFAERFTREARALAKLNHPNIVTIHDFGQTGGFFYFIMEFVDGVNLRQLEQTRRLTPAEALTLVPKICEALQYAHEEGIVHRDIKPGNLLLDKKGRVKIADFGLAKLLGKTPADLTLTSPGYVMGTLHYMAPEQMDRPQEVDHRADIYSLGVVFYEMLTGELPVGRFAPPSQKVQVDVRLDEVVLKSLETKPERRYQHASELKTAVETIGSRPPHWVPAPGGAGAWTEPETDKDTRRPWPGPVMLGVSIIAGLMMLWMGLLQLKVLRSNRLLRGAEVEWGRLEKQAARNQANLNQKVEMERKLAALNAFPTNRFLWSAPLNALQLCTISNIQVIRIRSDQSYIQTPPQMDRGRTKVLRPATSTEKLKLLIEARDFGGDEQYNFKKFIEKVRQHPYFLEHCQPPGGIVLESLSRRMQTPDGREGANFTLQCRFLDQVRP